MKKLPTTIKSCRECPFKTWFRVGAMQRLEIDGEEVLSVWLCNRKGDARVIRESELDSILKDCPLDDI